MLILSHSVSVKTLSFFKLFPIKTLKFSRFWILFHLYIFKIELKCQSNNNLLKIIQLQLRIQKVLTFERIMFQEQGIFLIFYFFQACSFVKMEDFKFSIINLPKIHLSGKLSNCRNCILFWHHFTKFLFFSNSILKRCRWMTSNKWWISVFLREKAWKNTLSW
jgi:hypothetical protein